VRGPTRAGLVSGRAMRTWWMNSGSSSAAGASSCRRPSRGPAGHARSSLRHLDDENTNAFVLVLEGFAFVGVRHGRQRVVRLRQGAPADRAGSGVPTTWRLKDRNLAVDRIPHQGSWEARARDSLGTLTALLPGSAGLTTCAHLLRGRRAVSTRVTAPGTALRTHHNRSAPGTGTSCQHGSGQEDVLAFVSQLEELGERSNHGRRAPRRVGLGLLVCHRDLAPSTA
jgi:hypothetical protein